MSVLLTGAHGIVGTAITTNTSRSYTLLDHNPASDELPDGSSHPHINRDTVLTDITNSDSLLQACDGHDAVVHLAGCPNTDAPYETVEQNNIRGTYNMLEAARQTTIESIVFASSNHVVGMYEEEYAPELYEPKCDLTVTAESPIRPDSFYGSSKAACEAFGRQFAEQYDIQFYSLRIGSVRPPRWDHPYGDAERGVKQNKWERGSEEYDNAVARLKCTWQSRRDIAQMVEKCLNDEDVTFNIFYGISENPNSWFDIDHAREQIGYAPRDSAEDSRWDEQYGQL